MKIKVQKLHEEAVLPIRANDTDAGYDLVCIDDGEIKKDSNGHTLYVQYRTGLAIQPEKGYHTELFPRSSITKTHAFLANSIGLIDEGYRGEILVRFKITPSGLRSSQTLRYSKGERIAQLVVRKTIQAEFIEVSDLNDSDRGAEGFGSSGS